MYIWNLIDKILVKIIESTVAQQRNIAVLRPFADLNLNLERLTQIDENLMQVFLQPPSRRDLEGLRMCNF